MPESRITAMRRSPPRQFVAQAEYLARALPAAEHVFNLSENRYHFLLGWVAACLREQVTLLPPSQSDDVLAKLRRTYPSHHTLDDESIARFITHSATLRSETIPLHWQLPAARIVAIAFTSGSTGASMPHPKSWGSLFHNSRLAAAEVLGGTNRSLVSTVPAQHMYGLEASLLSALTAESFPYDDKPFYPADVRRALAFHACSARAGNHASAPESTRGIGGRAADARSRGLRHGAAAGRARAAHRNRVADCARGDLRMHGSRSHGPSQALAI